MQHPWRTIIIVWLLLITTGLIVMGWVYAKVLPGLMTSATSTTQKTMNDAAKASGSPTFESDVWTQMAMLSDRVDALEAAATASGKNKTTIINTNTTTTVTAPATSGKVREVFLPMGGGSTNNRDWTNMTGAQIMFDPRKFGQIVSVRFEASGSIIGGEVHARLIDVTHNVIYYNTEVVMNTDNATWKRSNSFGIPDAPVTYQVQILSTSGETAYLQDSRLVIESKY